MKITLVNSEWLPVPPILGGAVETTIYETALSIQEPELTVISPWVPEFANQSIAPPNVFHHVNVKAESQHMRQQLGGQLDNILKGVESPKYVYYLQGVTNLLEKLNPDVIQIHNRINFASYLKKQFPNKRIVVYLHNHPDPIDKTVHRALPNIEKLVFVSHFLARRFHRLFPSSKEKSVVIHNSVNTNQWHPKLKNTKQTEKIRQQYQLTPGKTILFSGRTVYHKGISVLIDAIEHVRHEMPDIKLLIVGSPFFGAQKQSPFLNRLQKKAQQLKEHIHFVGFVAHDQTPFYYAAADITVVPSIWHEPFGKVVIESMATGTPVIASQRGAIPEIIDHNQNGILIEKPRKPSQIAAAIIGLLNTPTKRRELGIQARKKIENQFSKTHRINKTQHFYTTLAE